MEKVFESALIKNIPVCSIAKTTNLFTNSGMNVLTYILRMGGEGCWQYNNVADINEKCHKAEISIVKLNRKGRHCFRFEIFKMQKDEINNIVGHLADNSRDPSFPGYPYGLIAADRSARVSNKERDYLRNVILAKAGEDAYGLSEETMSNDAHNILDSIN